MSLSLLPTGLQAQTAAPEQVQVIGDATHDARGVAPTSQPLDATQPTSVFNQQYIQNNVPPQGDYAQIIALSPSVVAIDQNGPGGAFSGEVGIRGFQDGQYNVTLDGIPFGDSNNYTHHSSVYFANRDLGQVVVDRGPGTASTIGDATFGGTISLDSKAPGAYAALTPYASGGSFDTTLYGAQLDTGDLGGGVKAVFDGEHTSSAGALTLSGAERTNVFGKVTAPLGTRTMLTVVGMYNTTDQDFSRGASRAQIAQFGPDYGFSNDPTLQNYYKYNADHTHSDFEYMGIRSDLSEHWQLDDKLYTYAYGVHDTRALDVSNTSFAGTTYAATDVPGTAEENAYRAFGNVIELRRLFGASDVKVGAWVENQANSYTQAHIDLTRGNLRSPNNLSAFDYLDTEDLLTLQPYFEIDWRPLPGLVITPGVKYDFFQRDLRALVNSGTGLPLSYTKEYQAPTPAVTVHYAINPRWTAYFQYAQGFLAPYLNYVQVPDPTQSNVSPQKTSNYQVGTSWQSRGLSISGDLYYIDFSNMVASRNVGANTIYFNQGAVDYYGIEAEATVPVRYGFSLYANGSGNRGVNRATGQPIANAPEATAAGGLIYSSRALYASLLDKWVGSRYGDVGLMQGLDPFNELDASISVFVRQRRLPPYVLRVQFNNLLDSRKIDQFNVYVGAKQTPLYFSQPGRSVFASVELAL